MQSRAEYVSFLPQNSRHLKSFRVRETTNMFWYTEISFTTLFKKCHASAVTSYTIYYQNTHCSSIGLTALLQVQASRADISKYRCLDLSWLHKKAFKNAIKASSGLHVPLIEATVKAQALWQR